MDFNNQFKGAVTGRYQKLFKTVDEYINIVNKVIEKEQAAGSQVIYIQEVLPDNLFFRKFVGHSIIGTEGVKIHKGLNTAGKMMFTKKLSDAFTNKKFAQYIKAHGIDQVHIIGLDATKCAYFTAKGAIRHGLKVKMLSDALFTFYPQNTKKCEDDLLNAGAEYVSVM